MTTEQIEKEAQDYAQRLVNEYDQDIPELSLCDLKFDCQNAFIAGAQMALQNQWVSVDERLPEQMQRVLVRIDDEALVCWYTKSGRFKTTLRSQERYSEDKSLHERIHLSPCREDVTDVVTHWSKIPQLNPEKR